MGSRSVGDRRKPRGSSRCRRRQVARALVLGGSAGRRLALPLSQAGGSIMPCGTRARLTAYVAYQNLTFTELDVLLSALTDAGYTQLERALVGTEAANAVPVRDSAGRVIAGAALVVRGADLPTGFGDLGFVLMDGAYVPLVPSDARAERCSRRAMLAPSNSSRESALDTAAARPPNS